MGHAVALYTVRLSEAGDPAAVKRFGELAPDPTKVLRRALSRFDADPEDEDRAAKFLRHVKVTAAAKPSRCAAVLIHGQTGVNSRLRQATGGEVTRVSADVEDLAVMVYARLPRQGTEGVLALHVPHNRGVKSLLATHLIDSFRAAHPDLILRIDPVVPGNVLKAAVGDKRVQKVRLTVSRKDSDPFNSVQGWAAREDIASVELVVRAKRNAVLRGPNLSKFVKGELQPSDLVRFEGSAFDRIKVEVKMPNGRRRTVTLGDEDKGHPLMFDLPEWPNLHLGSAAPNPAQKSADLAAVELLQQAITDADLTP